MQIDKNIREQAVSYSVDAITHICNEIPPREPGSKGEKESQEYLAKDILDNNWADSVEFQPFTVAPKAFMGFSRIIPIILALGIIAFWWIPWAPIVASVVGLTIFALQFILYWQFLDPFYPKATSHNMIAVKKPTGEVKRRIILSGHADAAYEWTVFNKFGAVVHIGSMVYTFIGVAVSIILASTALKFDIKGILTTQHKIWMLVVLLIFTPGYLSLFLYSNYNRVVPGANDNLTGCLAAVGALKCLKEAGIKYENTEIMCVLTGSEEAGLRGAKHFAKEYKDKFATNGVETVFLALETFKDIEHMSIYSRDLSGTLKHDPRVISLLDKAAADFVDKPLPHSSVYVGASDAAAITKAGIPACTLCAMDPAPARYYHTRHDSPEILNPTCMALGLDITLKAVELFDKEGI